MQVPRPVIPAVLLVVAMVVVPLAGVALANAVRPVIPAEPASSADPVANLPAIPEPPATVQPLATWLEPLPVVDQGTDATPRPFLDGYRRVQVEDRDAGARLIDVAFDEIAVDRSERAATQDLLDALILEPPEVEAPDLGEFDDEAEVPEVDDFDTPAFRELSERAMTAFEATPSNARALNDLAVAIATTSLAEPGLGLSETDPRRAIAGSLRLLEAAIRLLELGRESFPTDRAIIVNLAYLRSLEVAYDEADEPIFSPLLPEAIAALQAHVDGTPADVTARSLLANLVVRTDPEHGLERAIAIAQPAIDDAEIEAAGRIIRADSLLFSADRDRTTSPFVARSAVRRALDDYDRAIELSGDAAAFAGRAVALDLLGSREAARASQAEAVRLTPSSVPWRVRLAQLDGCLGQTVAWRRDAQEALGAVDLAAKPPMVATRYILADEPSRHYGKYSVGSDLPTWDVTVRGVAGGTTIVAIDPFPEPDACMTAEPTAITAVEDAAIEVALAAIADDDLAAARNALEPWTGEPADDEEGEEGEVAESDALFAAATVLQLLAGGKLEEDDDSVVSFQSLASRLPQDAQARICRMLSSVAGLSQTDADALVVCAAEAVERTGDHEAAARAIEPAIRIDDPTDPVLGSTALQAGMISELAGHLEVARTRYEVAAAYPETSIGGLVRLGDLDLREGDASGALDHYALAKAALRTQAAAANVIVMDDGLAERLSQYVDNNRGIALLMTARTETDAPPDCVAYAATCRQAADAFAAAIAADPMNPVYPMNAAWVARLTGDGDRATALLTEALEEGIPLVAPAHNDLGVLAAQRGEFGDARAHFVQAIATDPDYDLATWNLGVLEASQAGPLIVSGQALLGRATDLNPDLLNRELAFQTDERVYRVEVSGTELELARAPGTGAAVGAAAFGAIATVGALAQLIAGLGGDVKDAAETVSTQGLARASRRLRGIGGRVRLGDRGWPSWAAWIPALVVLTVTTAWTAAWVAPDAFATALLIGLAAAGLSLVVHTCGHLVVAGRLRATLQPSGWAPGIALALVGMPFHVPAGPFLAEQLTTGDPRRDWWVSFAGVFANLAAAGIALLIYLAAPMPFLRVLIATQLAVAAFALIPSHPLDGDRLATQPIVLALMSLGVAAAATAIAVGAI